MAKRDSLRIEDYRDGTEGLVRCPRCGAFIAAHATMCPDCGVHFRGHAYEFAERYRGRGGGWRVFATWLVVGLIVAGLVAVVIGW